MRVVTTHTWAQGDTWWTVAARYTGNGLNWGHLALANLGAAPNPHRVPAGARIVIPELTNAR